MAIEGRDSSSEMISTLEQMPTRNNYGCTKASLFIAIHKLNRHKDLQWSQSVIIYIYRKGQYKDLNSKVPNTKDNPKFNSWKVENHVIMSWLIYSTTNEREIFFLYETGLQRESGMS